MYIRIKVSHFDSIKIFHGKITVSILALPVESFYVRIFQQ